jgi:hypothetical protein
MMEDWKSLRVSRNLHRMQTITKIINALHVAIKPEHRIAKNNNQNTVFKSLWRNPSHFQQTYVSICLHEKEVYMR